MVSSNLLPLGEEHFTRARLLLLAGGEVRGLGGPGTASTETCEFRLDGCPSLREERHEVRINTEQLECTPLTPGAEAKFFFQHTGEFRTKQGTSGHLMAIK